MDYQGISVGKTDGQSQKAPHYIVHREGDIFSELLTYSDSKINVAEIYRSTNQYPLGTYLIECINIFSTLLESSDMVHIEGEEDFRSFIPINKLEELLSLRNNPDNSTIHRNDFKVLSELIYSSFVPDENDIVWIGSFADYPIVKLISTMNFIYVASKNKNYCSPESLHRFMYHIHSRIPMDSISSYDDNSSFIHVSNVIVDEGEVEIALSDNIRNLHRKRYVGVDPIYNPRRSVYFYSISEIHELFLASIDLVFLCGKFISKCHHCHMYFISDRRNKKYCDGFSPENPNTLCRTQAKNDHQKEIDSSKSGTLHRRYRTKLDQRIDNKKNSENDRKQMAKTLKIFSDHTDIIRKDIRNGLRNYDYYIEWMNVFYLNRKEVDSFVDNEFLTVDSLYAMLSQILRIPADLNGKTGNT